MREKITHLKKILQSKDEFQEIMDYFFSVLAADPQFRNECESTAANPKMRRVIEITGQRLLKKKSIKINALQSVSSKKYQITHGFVSFEQLYGAYFYFDKIGGMVSLSDGSDGRVHYCRLTELPDEMILPRDGKRFEA